MNINVFSYSDITIDEQNPKLVHIRRLDVKDPTGLVYFGDVEVGNHLYTNCVDLITGVDVLAVYEIISIGGLTTTKIKDMVLKRINWTNNDTNIPTLPAFICSCDNYVDDIPSGDKFSISNVFTENSRTLNLKQQPKKYLQKIHISDIIRDDTAEKHKQFYSKLNHTPIIEPKVTVYINGVTWFEDEDITVDRENDIIYYDTDDTDDFDFNDLVDSTNVIRIEYYYL